MKTFILCLLLTATLVHAASIPDPSVQETNPAQPHTIKKRFLDWFDDDDYFDDFPLRRRRPSRRMMQLAQLIRQLAGPQGLTPAQMQNIQNNLQSLQMMQSMQQMTQAQNLMSLQNFQNQQTTQATG